MSSIWDSEIVLLLSGVFSILVVASIIGGILAYRYSGDNSNPTIDNLNARIRAWWLMCIVCVLAVLIGNIGVVILFALISFLHCGSLLP